ncbi:D-ribose pyranase [Bacillus massiliglaciei]|uniref:D-ribose pyranase n=1 Tax=Bacillus massiliglaciei TaxID=1816693 RepID=UPI000A9E97E5|nr:D-ribose pyranase [Bacillus massiliglaciei]
MKKHGVLNSHISKVLADLGHTDYIAVADAGLPVPDGVLKIDVAIKAGTPSFKEVVDAIAEDMVIEKVIMATEIEAANPETCRYLQQKFSGISQETMPHEEFKELTRQVKAIIRTGEIKPYANCILQSGVFF